MKVVVIENGHIEKQELFYELKRLVNQDRKDMNQDENDGADRVIQRLQNILF